MRAKELITTVTVAAMVLIFLIASALMKKPEKTLTAGFLYVGDGATAYTKNFMYAQEQIEEIYGERVHFIAKYNASEGKEEPYIQELVEEGCDIIFGTSYGYAESMKAAAKENPQIEFCQATGLNAQEEPVLSNYHTYMGHIYEGRYVCGIVAGMKLSEMLQEGIIQPQQALIGYVAAYPYAEVISGYTAFFLGVRSVCPDAILKVRYTNTWSDYAIEKKYAQELIEEGCVIISQHSDTTGLAVACETAQADTPVYLVSYNQSMLDVAPTRALGGCRINWVKYECAAVGALLNDKKIESYLKGKAVINGNDSGAGFSEGWVEMLELNDVIIADGTKAAVQKAIDGLSKGKVQVFQGEYTGTNPYDPSDTIDLRTTYHENAAASAPTFCYVLDDVIEIEE